MLSSLPPQVGHHELAPPQRHHVALHDGLGLRLGFLFFHVVMGLHVANHYVPELPLSTTLSAMGYLFDPPRARSSTSADSKGARTNPRCMEGRVLPLSTSLPVYTAVRLLQATSIYNPAIPVRARRARLEYYIASSSSSSSNSTKVTVVLVYNCCRSSS